MVRNYFSGMSGGWLGGWIIWKYNQFSPQLGWIGAWAELGNFKPHYILSLFTGLRVQVYNVCATILGCVRYYVRLRALLY